MTIEEYIEKDMPFYHITNMHNKESILKTDYNKSNVMLFAL